MPQNVSLSSASGQETKSLTIEDEMGVSRRMEKGETRSDVCRAVNLAQSTVATIMKNAENTKQSSQSAVNIGARPSYNTYSRNKTFEK